MFLIAELLRFVNQSPQNLILTIDVCKSYYSWKFPPAKLSNVNVDYHGVITMIPANLGLLNKYEWVAGLFMQSASLFLRAKVLVLIDISFNVEDYQNIHSHALGYRNTQLSRSLSKKPFTWGTLFRTSLYNHREPQKKWAFACNELLQSNYWSEVFAWNRGRGRAWSKFQILQSILLF